MATARLFKKQANEISSKWLSSANQVLPKDGIDICSVLLKKYSAKNLELEDLLNSIEEICLSHPNLISTFLHLFYDRPLLDDSSSLNDDSLLENDVSSIHSSANSLVAGQLSTDLSQKESIPEEEISRENVDPNKDKEPVKFLTPESFQSMTHEDLAPQRFYRSQKASDADKLFEKPKTEVSIENLVKPTIDSISTIKDTVENGPPPSRTRLPPINHQFKEPLGRESAPHVSSLPLPNRASTTQSGPNQTSAPAPSGPNRIHVQPAALVTSAEPKRKSEAISPLAESQQSTHSHHDKKKYSAKNDKKRTAEEQEEINKKLQLASQLIANVLSERISPNGSKKKKSRKHASVSN